MRPATAPLVTVMVTSASTFFAPKDREMCVREIVLIEVS
jgi:hypothetical protein